MNQIDWSKAPEGATHWTPDNSVVCQFLKFDKKWFWFGEGWVEYGHGDDWMAKQLSGVISRPEALWTGEGLPPVGAVVEASLPEWTGATVIAHGYNFGFKVAVLQVEDRIITKSDGLRPVRTPEQVAAEEREQEINEIASILTHNGTFFEDAERLYNAGCRMPGKGAKS